MRAAAITTAGAAMLVACVDGGPAVGERAAPVIGGAVTGTGEFPGVGALMYDYGDGYVFGCTGSLIAPDVVLTAAHCVDPELWGPIVPGFTLARDATGAAGVPDVVPGRAGLAYDAFDIEAPLEDGLGRFHDLGLLRLAAPITTVPPLRMARRSHASQIVAGLEVDIAGYGQTDPDTTATGVMYDARATVASVNAYEVQIGGGAPAPQNCDGDSGGPAFADFDTGRRVIGVVSRSFAGRRCVTGSIDTRVDAYLGWIHDQVADGIPCGSGLAAPCPGEPDDTVVAGGCAAGGRGGDAGLCALIGALIAAVRRRRR